jgi:hypothetical protein
MEWFVLGNEWDYSAVNPDSSEGDANQTQASSSNAPDSIFGLQYSSYFNGSLAGNSSSVPMLNRSSDAALFNDITNAEESATRNFFTGKLDGQLLPPCSLTTGQSMRRWCSGRLTAARCCLLGFMRPPQVRGPVSRQTLLLAATRSHCGRMACSCTLRGEGSCFA